MFDDLTLDPIDICGCGDTGYLTTRTVPLDLAHGVGAIANVPVYHCRTKSCAEFTLPQTVSRRLEDIAEEMESVQSTEAIFTWVPLQSLSPNEDPLHVPDSGTLQLASLQAFTLRFEDREYTDAEVILIVAGLAIFFRSTLDDTEYYLIRYEEESHTEGIWFSFLKFYYEEQELTYESFLQWSEEGYLKEIGRISLDEVEDVLIDEFGEWV